MDIVLDGDSDALIVLGSGDDTVTMIDTYNLYVDVSDGDDIVIIEGGGSNTIDGGWGDDVIDGHFAFGDLVLYGWHGDDLLQGGLGDDELFGEEDNDTLFGDWGNDYLLGGSGDDILFGDAGRDTLSGGSGDDYIVAGVGDTVRLGAGSDIVEIALSAGDRGMVRLMDFDPFEDQLFFTGDAKHVVIQGNLAVAHDADAGISVTVLSVGSTFEFGWLIG